MVSNLTAKQEQLKEQTNEEKDKHEFKQQL